jgi:hypothetical protein
VLTVAGTRAASERLHLGEPAYLIPRTLGCASACWSQPKVTVVAITNTAVTVRLPDGTEISVHADNVRRTRPEPRAERAARPRAALSGAEEIPLW